jgi:hypothetical protein
MMCEDKMWGRGYLVPTRLASLVPCRSTRTFNYEGYAKNVFPSLHADACAVSQLDIS